MTWEEFDKKYPEDVNERTKEFVNDCFDAYETAGFADKFWSPYEDNKQHIGKGFKVIGRCEEGPEWDLDSLPAWKIEFEDGCQTCAYPEEICPEDMVFNGYRNNVEEREE